MKLIDPHLHLFALDRGQYHWLQPDTPPYWPDKAKICRNFSEQDLALTKPLALAGFVHIEAGFDNQCPWREIDWLTENCSLPFVAVATVNLSLPLGAFEAQLCELIKRPAVVGVRDILDDNAIQLLSQADILGKFALLAKYQLSFDAQLNLVDNTAVTLLTQLLSKLPPIKVVVNHSGWPPMNNNNTKAIEQWKQGLRQLAAVANCAIKCSGWEMMNRAYHQQWLQQVINDCLAEFGEQRVMLASNFPLSTLTKSYQRLWQDYQQLQLTPNQQQLLLCDNAYRWYQFDQVASLRK